MSSWDGAIHRTHDVYRLVRRDGWLRLRIERSRRDVGTIGPDDGPGVGIDSDLAEQAVVSEEWIEHRAPQQGLEIDDAHLAVGERQLDDVAARTRTPVTSISGSSSAIGRLRTCFPATGEAMLQRLVERV